MEEEGEEDERKNKDNVTPPNKQNLKIDQHSPILNRREC